jgi:chemotaxis protein methyltransferase CheR
MSPQVFVIMRALIEEHAGLHYGDADRDLLAERVSARAQDAGFHSLLDYYYYLRYDPGGSAEMDILLEHLVVQETYLFRELDQLRTVVSHLLAPQIAQGRRPRIWSAACATGEEPVSLAVLLADRGLLEGVEIVATDISQRALDRARAGCYRRRSLRALGPETRFPDWLEPDGAGGVTVKPALVSKIAWSRLNLLDAVAVTAMGLFDVILCRNVLIYFSESTTATVIDRLTGALTAEGTLVVSVTESLLRFGTSLHCEERNGVFFYRKLARP